MASERSGRSAARLALGKGIAAVTAQVPGRVRRWLLPAIAILYVIPYPYFPALRSPNEGARLYQARALVDDGTFALDGELQRYGPMGDLSHSERGYFPNKAPGISMMGAVVYWVARAVAGGDGRQVSNRSLQYLLRLGCCELPTLALLYFLRRRLWSWTGDGLSADLALTAYALGSLGYTYGLLYFGHQLTAVCVVGSWLAIEAALQAQRRTDAKPGGLPAASLVRQPLALLVLAGLLAGSAVLVEYPGALAALPLGLYVLWLARPRWRSAVAFGLSSLPPQLLLLWYHKLAFGGFFAIGYRNNVSAQFNEWHSRGFMGVNFPTLTGLLGSVFSPARGLLVFSPFLLVGLYGLKCAFDRPALRPPVILVSALTGLYILFAGSFVYEGWGWTVGPRHITPLPAFLLPMVAIGLSELRRQSALRGGVAVGLCALSVVITSLATVTYPHFPEIFSNGFFEVSVPLLLSGELPQNLFGLCFSLPALGWILFFATWFAVLGWLLLAGGASAKGRWSAVATAAIGLLVLSLLGRGDTPQKADMLRFIRNTFRQQS